MSLVRRVRKAFMVYVDLDPIPGMMHTKESAQSIIRTILYDRLGHYNPVISLAPNNLQPEPSENEEQL